MLIRTYLLDVQNWFLKIFGNGLCKVLQALCVTYPQPIIDLQ